MKSHDIEQTNGDLATLAKRLATEMVVSAPGEMSRIRCPKAVGVRCIDLIVYAAQRASDRSDDHDVVGSLSLMLQYGMEQAAKESDPESLARINELEDRNRELESENGRLEGRIEEQDGEILELQTDMTREVV